MVHRVMCDRIVARGDNHQTLLADNTDARSHEDVIWQFVGKAEDFDPEEEGVHEVIEMSIDESLEESVKKAANGCARILGLEYPIQERIEEAVQVALAHASCTKPNKAFASNKKEKAKSTPRYFGLLPEIDLLSLIPPKLEGQDTAFWDALVKRKGLTRRPHVTIVHSKSSPAEPELWERCMTLHRMDGAPPLFRFKLGHIVWNDRIMGITVDELQIAKDGEGQEGAEFVSKLPKEVRDRLHITVGTRDSDVPAVETMGLVNDWRNGQTQGVHCVKLEGIEEVGRIKGLF